MFTIVHDDEDPFQVEAGGALLRDMGTVFNVVDDEGRLRVAVAEGAVRYESDRERAELAAGMVLVRPAGGDALVTRQPVDMIGAWQEGRLSYTAASYAEVAADLSRNLGIAVAVSDDVSLQTFSGTIMLGGGRDTLRERVGALLGVDIAASKDGWTLKARSGAPS